MENVYLISAARTPIGRFGGALKDFAPADLAAIAMRAALERAGVPGDRLDLYIFGNVLRAGHGQLIPRQAALKAGIPAEVDGYAVDMVCSSGMMALLNAAAAIRAGDADLVLAGGVESMSQAGFFLSHRARWGYKLLLGAPEPVQDILMYDGLTDPVTGEAMGEETERLAAEHGITRADLDEVAAMSQRRAAEATEKGFFQTEIIPIEIKTRRGAQTLTADEGIRPDTTVESLAALRPAFKKDGVLT
ncbi:MAG: thiolase family protein, partial [Caldilineae bacterium]